MGPKITLALLIAPDVQLTIKWMKVCSQVLVEVYMVALDVQCSFCGLLETKPYNCTV